MTLSITHTKVSGKAAGTDATRVYGTHWDAAHTLTGTVSAAQLNSDVVQTVTNDTNVTGVIATQNLTLGWTGTLALSRLAQGTDGQLVVGQTSAASQYKTLSGDATLSNLGVLSIGATKITSAMLNADVFSTAHSWGGIQTLTTPIFTGIPTGTGVASANTVSTLVARDGSGNFSAGTITASLTGHSSLDLALTGGTLTNNSIINWRNAANSADIPIIKLNAINNLELLGKPTYFLTPQNSPCDGVSDDAVNIQAAIDDLHTNHGGGHLIIKSSQIRLNSGVACPYPHVFIKGLGSIHQSLPVLATGRPGTKVVIGAGMTTSAAFRFYADDTKGVEPCGGGISGFYIECDSKAAYGVHVESRHKFTLHDIHVYESLTGGFVFEATSSGATGDYACENVTGWNLTSYHITNSAVGIGFSGVSSPLVVPYRSRFWNLNVGYKNGNGIQFNCGDNIDLDNVYCYRAALGTGNPIEVRGSNTSGFQASNIIIRHFSSGVSAVVKGTGTYTYAANNISFPDLDIGNGTPAPTIEAGATGCSWSFTSGAWTTSAPYTNIGAAPQVVLGANAATLGSVKLFGNTSGDATIQPAAVAGTSTVITLPSTTGTLATLAGTEELTNKTLNASVGKGTWTASGTWTLPAITLGGAVSGGGQNFTNLGSVEIANATNATYLGAGSITTAGGMYITKAFIAMGQCGIAVVGAPQAALHVRGADASWGNVRLEAVGNDAGLSFWTPNVGDTTNGRNWKFATNLIAYGDFGLSRSTAYNTAPTTTVLSFDNVSAATFVGGITAPSLRVNQTPTAVGTGTKTISNAVDSSTNFGHYASFNMNGTTYYFPCGATAPT